MISASQIPVNKSTSLTSEVSRNEGIANKDDDHSHFVDAQQSLETLAHDGAKPRPCWHPDDNDDKNDYDDNDDDYDDDDGENDACLADTLDCSGANDDDTDDMITIAEHL